MTTTTTTARIPRRSEAGSVEEEAILDRFWTRVSSSAHKAVHSLSHGSFLVL